MNIENLTRRAKTSEKKRDLIIETAIRCFIEKGFHQTSIRDIAAAANISVGNLYNHFASKSALILELAEIESRELEDIIELLGSGDDPKKVLARFIDQFLEYSADPVNTALSVEFFAEASRNIEVGEAFLKNRTAVIEALKRLLERGIGQGEFTSEIKPAMAPEFIIDLIEGLALRFAQKGKKPDKAARLELHLILERYLQV